jgi:tRNA-Thr(GGU) m(6)t(6)A37 methyltransferase TsaA
LPPGWHSLTPRIVTDDVAGLVDFLRTAFGATGDVPPNRPAELRIGDSVLMISAAGPRAAAPAFLYLYVDDADATYRRAIDAGAESAEEPGDTPYGDRRAMVNDRWGNTWQIATYGPRPPEAEDRGLPETYSVRSVGTVRSPLSTRKNAPRQGDEGAPDCWIDLHGDVAEALDGLQVGGEILLITWLHQSKREVLKVHPRSNPAIPLTGVFATRSPDRPNPLGLHRVTLLAIEGTRLKVGPLEAIDGTPVVDIKPVLSAADR